MQRSFLSGQRQRTFLIFLLFLLGIIPLFFLRTSITLWDFRNNLWAPAHLFWQGKSPYAIQELFPNAGAVWMPPAISAYGFVGLMEEPVASRLWLYISVVALVALVGFSFEKRPSPGRLAFAFLFVFLYAPTVSHLRLGQISILTALWLLLAARLIQSEILWGQGLLLSLASAKPQLLFLTLPGIFYKNLLKGKYFLFRVIVWTGGFITLFSLPLFLADAAWWQDFLTAIQNNPTWLQPSIWQLWPRWWGIWGWAGAFLLTLLGIIFNFLCWHKLPAQEAVYWGLAITPLITPYVWSWDFTLQAPLFFLVLFRVRRGWALLIVTIGGLACILMATYIALTTDGSNHRYWWLSWCLFALLAAAHFVSEREENRSLEVAES